MLEKMKKSILLLLLLLIGAVYFFLEYIAPLVAPILIAMLFVTIFGSMLKKMQKLLHIHRQVGVVLLLLLALVILVLLVWILFSWIVGSLPEWMGSLDALETEMIRVVHSVCGVVGYTMGIDSVYLECTLVQQIQDGIDFVALQMVPDMLSQSLVYVKMAAAVGGFLITFVIATILLAKDYDDIMNRLLDREECHILLEVICGVIRYIATFVKAQIIIMSIIAAVAAAVLGIAGVKHGILWGILAGLLDALPFIGTGIVLLPLALVQLFQGDYLIAFIIIVLYVTCIFLREILEPKFIGKRIGVSPIAILLSLYAGIQLFGVCGIIKGPLGFIIIYQTYVSLRRRREIGNL